MFPIAMTDMKEATRLTREGRLGEALAILQGRQAAAPPSPKVDLSSSVDVVDLHRPSDPGGVWRHASDSSAGAAQTRSAHEGPAKGRKVDAGHGPGPAGRFEPRSHVGAAGSRAYKIYVPSSYTGQPMPLIVMLHGCTQSPDDFAAGTGMNGLGEELGFFVAYPAQPSSANVSKCWNWFNGADQGRGKGEPALIAGITRQVSAEFAVQPDRVYVAGLSAGGAAAAIMGAAYPDLYAAVGVHSGLACGAARDMASALAAMQNGGAPFPSGGAGACGVPTIVFHGTLDRTVHPINAAQVADQAVGTAAVSMETLTGRSPGGIDYTRTIRRDRDGRVRGETWLLHGVAHAWSGGSAKGTYTDPRGPDASREMVRFFLENRS